MNDPRRTRNKKDPKETLNEVLNNIHESLKWYWQVVMGLAMVKAIETLYNSMFDNDKRLTAALSFVFVFVPMFIRFYFGDSRYLDQHYIEHRKWRPINEYLTLIIKYLKTDSCQISVAYAYGNIVSIHGAISFKSRYILFNKLRAFGI